jgi:hypothetical protein
MSIKHSGEKQAFPTGHCSNEACDCATEWGMSLRDWFAGMAIMGKAFHGLEHEPMTQEEKEWYSQITATAYKLSDAMLKKREKEK